MGILQENFRAWAKGRGTEFTIQDLVDSKVFQSPMFAYTSAKRAVDDGWLIQISQEKLGVYMWTAPSPFIKGKPTKMVALWKIHEILHTKRDKVRAKYHEISSQDNPKTGYIHRPRARAELVGSDSAIADILDALNKLV